jgi:tetratricopeptide (TPR) repeat protein
LKLQPIRVSQLCLRSAFLHLGNALAALDRNAEAREVYEKVLPMLATEPRCGRLDWERSSIIVNIGNTYCREGNFDRANDYYDQAEKLGQDHLDVENGNQIEGMGIKVVAMRARSFALKKVGKDDEAKIRLREVLELQLKLNVLEQQKKKKEQLETIQAEQQSGQQPVVVA